MKMGPQYLIIISICGYAIGALFYKYANNNLHPLVVSSIITGVYIILTPLSFVFLKFDRSVNSAGILFAVLGALATCAGSLGYFFALKAGGGAGQVTAVTSVYPALTLILSWFFLGEPIGIKKIIGIVFALASVILLSQK
jgi:Predicted membrane protein